MAPLLRLQAPLGEDARMSTVAPHGLHHVTAIADDPQRNVDFYTHVLGLRLVKQTVNFDAPDTYHLYYGDEAGPAVQPAHLLPVAGRAARPPGHRAHHRHGVHRPGELAGLVAAAPAPSAASTSTRPREPRRRGRPDPARPRRHGARPRRRPRRHPHRLGRRRQHPRRARGARAARRHAVRAAARPDRADAHRPARHAARRRGGRPRPLRHGRRRVRRARRPVRRVDRPRACRPAAPCTTSPSAPPTSTR